ncbi:hypothetical protein K505DRAFT_63108 [Melanomma pulvis-pyrius CBS 109.77]|uniref:Uncharacterized protein n=1 Tax=Melanomma pulvis-pyrius CBS 109.77 TaxID=1314802 RepID=A0A6A6XSA1_9PLEO|nr:hypothetical protein K505DRAFT_63108 [Melanomma pulvis-pyrius CBS 109.77]
MDTSFCILSFTSLHSFHGAYFRLELYYGRSSAKRSSIIYYLASNLSLTFLLLSVSQSVSRRLSAWLRYPGGLFGLFLFLFSSIL